MCTVTYIPTTTGYLLTSSRDEARARPPALAPASCRGQTGVLLYPKDRSAGGTWFVLHAKGHAGVLLNGAWQAHQPHPPYRLSRGLILLQVLDNADPLSAFDSVDLENIEPFTLILAQPDSLTQSLSLTDPGIAHPTQQVILTQPGIAHPAQPVGLTQDHSLHTCRWDGREKYRQRIDASAPAIWSSVTLYDPVMAGRRETWFRSWLHTHPSPDQVAVLDFHRTTGDGDPQTALLMNRDDRMLTVSITSLEWQRTRGHAMVYQDVLSGQTTRQSIFPDTAIPQIA